MADTSQGSTLPFDASTERGEGVNGDRREVVVKRWRKGCRDESWVTIGQSSADAGLLAAHIRPVTEARRCVGRFGVCVSHVSHMGCVVMVCVLRIIAGGAGTTMTVEGHGKGKEEGKGKRSDTR